MWLTDLMTEQVAGEGQHSQLLGTKPVDEQVHLGKVPSGCASEGGGVLNQHHLPLVLAEVDRLSWGRKKGVT